MYRTFHIQNIISKIFIIVNLSFFFNLTNKINTTMDFLNNIIKYIINLLLIINILFELVTDVHE